MKRLSYLPLLCTALFAGCNTPAANSNAATTAATTEATANTATTAATEAPTEAPAKTYVVKDADQLELGEGAPADLVKGLKAALKKVAVPTPPLDTKLADKIKVTMDTTRGPIKLELDTKAAPLHVRSFVYLVGKGFYDGTVFHRYADLLGDGKGFIIQGGDPLSKDNATSSYAGLGGPGYEIPREHNDLKHNKLVIAAARSQNPDSAGSQFYITQGPVTFLDEGDGYTVFGKVIEGQTAAMKLRKDDKIKSVKIDK